MSEEGRMALSLRGVQPVAQVPRRMFGSFVEHLGRCVYGGIYEPGDPAADEDGFRRDVLDLVKELGVTCVRYPGGNFVSGYNWEDGTGPRQDRPVRRDLAWHATETNQMGIDDFYRWSHKAGTEIMLAVNMGTRGMKSALEELEYVNGAPGTELADRRVANGIPDPMGVAMWCIGNEMDGPWQVGHMSPEEYAAAVDRTAHAMKLADPGLQLVACGSSSAHMPTFGRWERTVLGKAYEHVDFVSCHAYYYEHRSEGLQDFMASDEDMKTFITSVVEAADDARAANQGRRNIMLSFDEWGVWNSEEWNQQETEWKASSNGLHTQPWPEAPRQLEEVYTAADAVVEGGLMITLLKHSDRVRSASRAQLVNVIAPIMAEPGQPAWRQTIFYPFAIAAAHARGDVYLPQVEGDAPQVETRSYGSVDAVEAVVTWDPTGRGGWSQEGDPSVAASDGGPQVGSGSGLVLAVNRDVADGHQVTLDLRDLGGQDAGNQAALRVVATHLLHDDDPHAVNGPDRPGRVAPHAFDVECREGVVSFDLPPVSWAAIELSR